MTLLEDWQEFERNILPVDFGEMQREKCKFAFYSGALRIIDQLLAGASCDVNSIARLSGQCQEIANSIVLDARARLDR